MCMLGIKPAGVSIPRPILERVVDYNPHGHGLAWVEPGFGIRVWKHTQRANRWVRKVEELEGATVLFHTRWATHGVRTDHNVHPFWLGSNKQAVLAHNGIITSVPNHKSDSDTRVFVNRVLNHLPDRWWHDDTLKQYVSRRIGKGNKFAVLDVDNKFAIINEAQGEWYHGVWYSNAGFRGVDTKGWGDGPACSVGYDDDFTGLEPETIVGYYSEDLWTCVCVDCYDQYQAFTKADDIDMVCSGDKEAAGMICDACGNPLLQPANPSNR